jgi:Ca-activated chloride channel homolog
MKALRVLALVFLCSLGLAFLSRAQQGPLSTDSETVAKPKKNPDTIEPDQAPIPSKYGKEKELPQSVPTFRSDATTVSVDVAVLDNKNHFIPKIPKGNFRVLEDNVPQQVTGYSIGEAPMTITMVIEFSPVSELLLVCVVSDFDCGVWIRANPQT